MSTESVTAILARVAGEHALVTGDEGCGSRKCAAGCRWDHYAGHLAEKQAAALTEAGLLVISAEGLPSREELLRRADFTFFPEVHALYARIADALSKPLPTAPWSVIECKGDHWVLDDDGDWCALYGGEEWHPDWFAGKPWTLVHDGGAA